MGGGEAAVKTLREFRAASDGLIPRALSVRSGVRGNVAVGHEGANATSVAAPERTLL
jgi:hypothetical protein